MHFKLKKHTTLFVFLFTLVTTLGIELALVERKYAIFNGGFLSSHVLDSTIEIALFFITLLLAQITTISFILFLFLKTGKANLFVKYYNFMFFTFSLVAITLGIKYKLLSYFSDAVSFELIKNLGGGSILDAILYVMDEAVLISAIIFIGIFSYWLGYKLLCRIQYAPETDSTETIIDNSWLTNKKLYFVLFFCLLTITFFFSNKQRDIKYGLNSFLSYNLINSAFSKITDFDRDSYSYFTSPIDQFPFDATKYPFALDTPDNDIDEDGFLGDFKFRPSPPPRQKLKSRQILNILYSSSWKAQEEI